MIARARRHTLRPSRDPLSLAGMGPLVTDAVSGFTEPERLCVEQRGGMVREELSRGSRDLLPEEEEYGA